MAAGEVEACRPSTMPPRSTQPHPQPPGAPGPRREILEHENHVEPHNGRGASEEADDLHPPRLPLLWVIQLLAPWRSRRATSTHTHADMRGQGLRASACLTELPTIQRGAAWWFKMPADERAAR
ncbi:uncharacterized protein LOC124682069 [Lolium rigidum]|uniref:uncharacterized protein LOC124682069 n=1 Tax=Lolium rigidum TaxID=89674 RepID=UPI001F5C106D|nr:uncharacterized protein LOC124682069 [Lolium rigidum]